MYMDKRQRDVIVDGVYLLDTISETLNRMSLPNEAYTTLRKIAIVIAEEMESQLDEGGMK